LLAEANVKAIIALGPTPGFKIWESIMSIRDQLPSGLPVWSVTAPGSEHLPQFDLDLHLSGQRQGQGQDQVGLGSIGTAPTHAGSDVAAYVHSGGTTGLPKIVKLSHQNISYRHWTLQLAMQMTLGEVVLQDTPIFHVGGLAGRCLPMLASGASLVIPSLMGARDKRYIANYWKFIARFRVTRLSGVPTTFSVLAKSPPQGEDLSSLKRNFVTGSTALPISVRREFERVSGVRILNSYGLTENTASVAIELRDGQSREGSSGVSVPYTRVRVKKIEDMGSTTSESCGPDQTGMIQVSGPGVALGYLNDSHTQASRTSDGWLITGDLGRIDSDGNLFVTGRSKDVIIRGGHNIDPGLIENALLQSPEVLLAAAVGKPDAHAGELPVAYVQLVAGSQMTEADLLALAARIPERAAIPKEIFVVDKLPLTDTGKPAKVSLRHDAAERTFRAVLSKIPGLSTNLHGLQVAVTPHPLHGTLVTLTLPPSPHDAAALVAAIDEIMSRYSLAYAVNPTTSGE
jgi:fatty-acyl-CoA synthase